MRTIIGTTLILCLGLMYYPYQYIEWAVAVGNSLIIMYWMFCYRKHEYLPVLGMVGTLVGLMLAFSTIEITSLSNTDVVKDMIGSVLAGVGLSITTTLTGVLLWMVEDWHHA